MFRAITLFTGLLICLAVGCGGSEKVPDVGAIPVSGKVVEVNGSPATGGMVMLRSIPNGEHNATGVLNDKGEFTLSTIVGVTKVDGIPEGEYRVTFARLTTTQSDLPVDLKQTYKITPTTTEVVIKLE